MNWPGSAAPRDTVWIDHLGVQSAAGTADAGIVIRHLALTSTAIVHHKSTTLVSQAVLIGPRLEVTWFTAATKDIDWVRPTTG